MAYRPFRQYRKFDESMDVNNTFIDYNLLKTQPKFGYKNTVYPPLPAQYICSENRNIPTHYIYGREITSHPDFPSRFGFAHCPNGYCSGQHPGRYATSLACYFDDYDPPGMNPWKE